MGTDIQTALKIVGDTIERRKSQPVTPSSSVEQALNAYETSTKRNINNIVSHIQNQYNKELEKYNSYKASLNDVPEYSIRDRVYPGHEKEREEAVEKQKNETIEKLQASQNNITSLKNKLSGYKGFIQNDGAVDKMMNAMNQLQNDYNFYIVSENSEQKWDFRGNRTRSKYGYYNTALGKEGFENIQADMESLQKPIEKAYNGWQSESKMRDIERSVNKACEVAIRLQVYCDANGINSGDLPKLIEYYKKVENDLENLGEVYSEYSSASNYKKGDKETTWFQGGLFADGSWDWGDLERTVLATLKDTEEELLEGVFQIGEGVIDAGASLAALGTEMVGADKTSSSISKFVKKDIVDEEKLSKLVSDGHGGVIIDQITGGEEIASVLGDKSEALLNSGGQLVGDVALAAVGIPMPLTIGVTSFGSQTEAALNDGANIYQAAASGAVSAAAEVALEKISGGIKFGKSGKTLDELTVKRLTQKISDVSARKLVDWGVDVAGEGFEEALTEFVTNVSTKIYKEDNFLEIIGSDAALDSYLEAAIGGGVIGGSVSGFNLMSNSVKAKMSFKNKSNGIKSLIEKGLSMPEDSYAYKIAKKLETKLAKNAKVSGLELSELVKANRDAVETADISKIEYAVGNRLTALGENKAVSEVAEIITKKVTGRKLTSGEIHVLRNSSYGNRVINEMKPTNVERGDYSSGWVREIKTDIINRKIYNNPTDYASTTDLQSQENSLQAGADNGIIENNQETGVVTDGRIYNQGAVERENNIDPRGKSQVRQSRQTIDGYVERGKGEVLEGMAGEAQRRVRINHTPNSSVSFTEGKADNAEGYKAYSAFANAGIKAIYCEGPIERTVNGVTVSSTEAFTTPDGTVYVSSESSLPPKQTFDHEKVHVAQKTNNPAYNEYESILYEEIEFLSDSYKENATKINANQFNNKYDIEDIDTGPIFMREIAAYINQFVLSDPAFAKETFGGMFGDWGAVVDAVNKFNTDMKADFTESASFMPENDNADGTVNYNVEILSVSRKNKQRRHTTAKEQTFIKKVAKALGVKLEFTDITVEHLRSLGYEFNDSDILPDGYYDRDTKTIYLGFSAYNPLTFVFKHELTHFGEGTVQYERLVKAVKKSEAFKKWLEKKTNLKYTKDLEDLYLLKLGRERRVLNERGVLSEKAQAEMHCEMIADFVGECIFTDDTSMLQNMLSDLDYKERNVVVQYILDFLSYLKKKLAGNKDILFEISRLEDSFNRMLSEAVDINKETPTENGGELQFSIKTDVDGRKFVDVTEDILDIEDGVSIARAIQKIISSKFNNLINVDGQKIQINKISNDEFRRSNSANLYAKNSEEVYKDKLRTISNADEILKAARNWIGEKPNHIRKDDIVEFARADILYRVGKNGYVADVLVATRKNGAAVLYDIVNIYDKQIVEAPVTMESENSQRRQDTSTKGSLPQKSPTVNNNSKKDLQFSFARVQDEKLISKAEKMEKKLLMEGKGPDITRIRIWGKYGIIRDAAREWIYEIDDHDMELYPLGNAIKDNPEIKELYNLENAKRLSKQKMERYSALHDKYNYAILRSGKLEDFIKHPKLFEAFPQLKEVNFEIQPLSIKKGARYDISTNTIMIDTSYFVEIQAIESGKKSIKDFYKNPYEEVKRSVIHEVQHVLQTLEDREPGASAEYWAQRFQRTRRLIDGGYLDESVTPRSAYWYTMGEYEARVSENRLDLTEEERKRKTPWLGWYETISAREIDAVASNKSYMSAVESGNTNQLQKMVDDAALSNGYSERLYHQTGAEFTEFNTDNELAGKYDWELPTGIFLKPSNKDIGLKGKKQMELFAKVNNPLEFKDRAEARAYWSKNIEGYRQAVKAVEEIDNEYREKDDDAIMELQSYMRQWRRDNPDAKKGAIYNDAKYQRLADKEAAIMEEWEQKSDKASIKAKKLINNFMAESGYDGIVIEHDADGKNHQTKSYIVFDSSQLKTAAPIAYDNNGEVIPLSQRFNQDKKDIRFSVPSVDSYTEELLDMYESGEITKAEYKAAMDKYWDDVIAEVQDTEWAKQLELIRSGVELKKRIKRQNEQLARRRSEISEEITAQREERATKQKNIEHIRKTVSRIDKMLRTNSESKHVPEDLKNEITQFVSVFVANDRSPFDKKDLRNIYLTYSDALRQSASEEMANGLDEDILRDIKTLRDRLDGKTLRDLNYHETLLVRDIVDNFAQIIKYENEIFIAGKEIHLNEIGNQAIREITAQKSKRENFLTKGMDNAVVYANMTPVYFFDKIGGVFKTLFNDVVEAQNKWFRNAENGKTFIRQIKEKYHYSEWADDTFKFTTEKGDEIEITREQAMLLYATAKREYGNNFQKAEHLFRGGVVIEPNAKKLRDVIKKFKASDEKGRKRIAEAFSEEVDSRAHRITPDDVLKIKFWLTDDQLAYVDAFVEYLSTDMAALGNEISMQLYGIKKYNEKYYIPYNSAQNFLYSQPGVTNETRLKHQSFTKNTVVGANNPLVLSDFSTVCADHINRMCMYNALTMPLENMNKIFNFKTTPGIDSDVRSVQSEIERTHGEAAVSYIKTFIEDMNGNVRVSNTDKAINRWISKFKKGAVFASASVVVQQPSAIIRAMAYIKPKYFAKTTLKLSERDYQECVRYAPVAGIKEMGRFDTGVGAATTNWLLQETPYGFKNKVKALFSKDSTYRDDKMSYFAAKADEITWAHIWAAVKAEIADTTDLKIGSKEYFEACGRRFTDVINYTQVYDSTISRSQMMRSKSTGAQMLTAFMSEPTVSLNLLMNAADRAKNGGKEGKHFAVGAVAAFVGSVALNSILKSLVTAARDDDEEKTYLQKYGNELLGNFTSDINPMGLIPFVKDVQSIFEGYTVERADMNLFSDLAQSIKYLNSDSKTSYEKFESVMGSLSAFLGLPVKNVLRDGRATYNLCNNLFVTDKKNREINKEVEGYLDEYSENETYDALAEEDKEKLEKNITNTVREVKEAEGDKQKRDKFDELYAEKRKSQKAYNEMRKKMLEEGYTEAEITDGVEIARIAYMKTQGIDIGDYLLYKIATSKKYADTDKSGGVSKKEKEAVVREMDIDEKIKKYFLEQHK